jgi:two-component system chemotaxis response regulator CheB
MIRVLIVDDSPTARTLLTAILSSDPELQIVGEAVNGLEAVELTRKLRPDVVTMDIRMPKMDGFEATKEIMIATPTPIVIVTSSHAVHEVEMSMHALRAGALAIIQKPVGPAGPGFDEAAQQLIGQVKAMAHVKVVRHWRPTNPAAKTNSPGAPRAARARLIAIATSTGGPAALHTLLSGLPDDFATPILVVQHISHGFIRGLADWLNKAGRLHVKVAEEGETIKKHTVYLAPDDAHLGISMSGLITLSAAPPIGGFRPSGSHLFESVAKAYASTAVALILTGMGSDGVAGLHAVRQAGGWIIAQNEKSCVVFGMPSVAIAANLADEVLPLEEMSGRLAELVV